MREITHSIYGLVFFLLLWFIFATFQWPNGSVRVYQLYEVVDPKHDWPSHGRLGRRIFRINEGYVTELTSSSVRVYKNCSVWNKNNWECLTDSKQSKFGMLNGEFFDILLKENIGPIKIDLLKKKYVSELKYHLNGCAWDRADGGLQLIACSLRPFFNSY